MTISNANTYVEPDVFIHIFAFKLSRSTIATDEN